MLADPETQRAHFHKVCLQAAGYTVHVEDSSTGVLNYLTAYRPQAVLIHLTLNEQDGLTVCRSLRNRSETWTLPIILLARKGTPVPTLRNCAATADAILNAAASWEEILRTLRTLLGELAPPERTPNRNQTIPKNR
ncbi:MAG: hypothetical protein COV76_04775 [Candidatus Omnitrophica bacterium CG11_big_fil_rev_8_21_14_0_20_64_10]|nr:MAG: hypothetical protein COV76_04775 [Candidatus Omnitrophica bacterium CG11_big_fil_rev_8_21_14_0_20_64_10]